jgi:hypothetical protein
MRTALVTAFSAAILYGASYQQFRFFSLENPGGATDAIHYVSMARGDLSIRLAFYMVNFAFSLAAAIALFGALQVMRYSMLLSLLGVSAFAASRVTALVTATPLVDASYFCAIAILTWLTLEQRALALALIFPLLVLTKETVIPFLLLPFITPLRKSRLLWAGAAAAGATYVLSGRILDASLGHSPSVVAAILDHGDQLGASAARALTIQGVYDLQNGFSLMLPLSVIGAWLNTRHRYHQVPAFMIAAVAIAIAAALLSGNLGRMFFAGFPVVIAYALIAVEHVARDGGVAIRDSL